MTADDSDLCRQGLRGKTIYVVEDMEVPRAAMVGQLLEVGCHAVACQSAEELEERLTSLTFASLTSVASGPAAPPDLILLDLELPGRSGLETLRWLRGSERWRHVPVVVVTADEDSEIVDEALSAGCRSYLSKPVRTHHLVATCAKALR